MNRLLLSVGLSFLILSIGSLFILTFLHTPMHVSGKIPLSQPVISCGGGCGGSPPFLISQSTLADGLVIKYEWPKHMDINGSESISVALTLPPVPQLASSSRPISTPTPIGNVSDRGINSFSPSSLYSEAETNCANGSITDPHLCQISSIFGKGYKMSTTSAYMVTTSFDTKLMEPVERSVDQPFIEWDWNIFPKSTGLQVIDVGIGLQWTPTDKVGGTTIFRQLWESPIAIEVDKPLIDVGQLSLSTIVSGVFGTVFTGISLPWFLEQRSQTQEKRKKKRKYCRSCGAENSEYSVFCNKCGESWDSSTEATISSSPASSPRLTKNKQSSTRIAQEMSASASSQDEK